MELLHVRLVSRNELLGSLWQNFYRPDAFPITEPTASKHSKITVPEGGQHAAAVDQQNSGSREHLM